MLNHHGCFFSDFGKRDSLNRYTVLIASLKAIIIVSAFLLCHEYLERDQSMEVEMCMQCSPGWIKTSQTLHDEHSVATVCT